MSYETNISYKLHPSPSAGKEVAYSQFVQACSEIEKKMSPHSVKTNGYDKGTFTLLHYWGNQEDRKFINISKKHPDIIIELTVVGEDVPDFWKIRFLNGQSEIVRGNVVYEEFKEILLENEKQSPIGTSRSPDTQTLLEKVKSIVRAHQKRKGYFNISKSIVRPTGYEKSGDQFVPYEVLILKVDEKDRLLLYMDEIPYPVSDKTIRQICSQMYKDIEDTDNILTNETLNSIAKWLDQNVPED